MAWVKISEELYSSDQSNFSLEKIDGIWYVIDNSRQAKSIPFTDIFNNPVFPVDFSNVDLIVKNLVAIEDVSGDDAFFTNRVFAKHFRAESANTPNTPGFSFQSDIDTGFYHISDGIAGFSSNGIKTTEFNDLGSLNGNQGVDFRNLIKNTTDVLTRVASPTLNSSTTSASIVSSGVGIQYTPKKIGSIVKISFLLSVNVIWNGATGTTSSFIRPFKDNSLIPNLAAAIPGTSTALNLENTVGTTFNNGVFSYQNTSFIHYTFYDLISSLNNIYYYLGFRTGSSTSSLTLFTANGTDNSRYIVEEYY